MGKEGKACAVKITRPIYKVNTKLGDCAQWQDTETTAIAAAGPELAPPFFTREDFQRLIDFIKENSLKEINILVALTGMSGVRL